MYLSLTFEQHSYIQTARNIISLQITQCLVSEMPVALGFAGIVIVYVGNAYGYN